MRPTLAAVLPLVLLTGMPLLAQSAAERNGRQREKASLYLEADRTAYEPGAEAVISALVSVEPGWHVNSNQPTYDYLIGTQARFELPPGWPPPSPLYPHGEMQRFAFAEEPLSVYDGQFAITAVVELPADIAAGEWPVTATLTYQACNDRSCLPPVTTEQTLHLRVGAGGKPVEISTSEAGGTSHGGRQPAGMAWVLLLGFVGGLILNAMPCVLPVLSLKVFGLVKSAGRGRTQVVIGSLGTAFGILLSFWGLALAAVLARSAGAAVGWGVQFQEPAFVTFLALVVVLFCLNLWGLFEIPLPAGLARVAGSGPTEGLPGHLVSGVFATLMATPCSAPFLGTAVGFALSQTPAAIFAIFTSIGLGMALPYLALAAAPGAARLLPKPGAWMETFKVVMGFLLAGAVIWLFYVLASQISAERLAFIEVAILALALFVWLRHRGARSSWSRRLALGGIALTMAASLVLAAQAQPSERGSAGAESRSLIPWVTFDRQEAERLAADGRMVFVDVTADWCITCKFNERLVLETDEVAAAFERHRVVPMKADWTNRNPGIESFLADFGRSSVPTYLLYRPGREPHLFPELLTIDSLIEVVEESAGRPAEAARSTASGPA